MKNAQTPTVSVILTAYKEPLSWFAEALKSITTQTYKDLEILTIIDNPQDTILSNYLKNIASIDNRLRIIKNDKNIGLAQSLNIGISLARGKYICRMDADDISKPCRIQEQLDYLKKMDYDLIGGQVEVINENDDVLYSASSIPHTSKKITLALRWNNCVAHPTWFGKKEAFSKLYRNIPLCEDYDFLLRTSLEGGLLGNIPSVVLSYRMSSNSISRNNLYRQYLSQCYLAKEYKNGSIAEPEKIAQFISVKYSDQKSNNYIRSNILFNSALYNLSSKNYVRACTQGLKAFFSSRGYANKIRRLFCASLYQ